MKSKIAALLLAGLAFSPLQAAAQDKEPIKIVQSTSSAAFMPYLTALSMGYFDEAGLDVEIIQTSSGSKVGAAVAAGAADVGMASTSTALYLRSEGVDIRMLAPITVQYTTGVVFSQKWADEHGITEDSSYEDKLAALKGARLGTPGSSAGEHILRYLADEAGLNPDRDLTIVPMGSELPTYQVALEQGVLDGFSLSSPSPDLAVRDLNAVYAFNLSQGEVPALENFLYTVVITNGNWLERNPETAAKVIEAIRKGASAILSDATTEEARDRVREAYFESIDPDLFARIWDQAKAFAPRDMQIEAADVERVMAFSNRFADGAEMKPEIIEGSLYVQQ